VIAAWQQWAPNGPEELSADLELTAAGDIAIAPTVEVHGAVLGSRHDADGLLDELTALAGTDPLSRACAELSYHETIGFQAAPRAVSGQAAPALAGDSGPRRHRFTKSGFFDEPLPSLAIGALAAHLAAERVPGQDRSVIFAPLGRQLQAAFKARHRVPAPKPALSARAPGPQPGRRIRRGQPRRASVGHQVVGIGVSLGNTTGVPELSRSRARRPGACLLRR